jgi:hypothetical protein
LFGVWLESPAGLFAQFRSSSKAGLPVWANIRLEVLTRLGVLPIMVL